MKSGSLSAVPLYQACYVRYERGHQPRSTRHAQGLCPAPSPDRTSRDVFGPAVAARNSSDVNKTMLRIMRTGVGLRIAMTIVRRWGRISCRGRFRLDFCDSAEDAYFRIERLLASKRRRGYGPDRNGQM